MKTLLFSKSVNVLEFQGTSSTAFSDHQKYDSFFNTLAPEFPFKF